MDLSGHVRAMQQILEIVSALAATGLIGLVLFYFVVRPRPHRP